MTFYQTLSIAIGLLIVFMTISCDDDNPADPGNGNVPPIEELSIADNFSFDTFRRVNLSVTTQASGDTTAPVITVVGNNPANIALNTSYVDLGATVTDDTNNNLGISYKLDGVDVTSFSLDTSSDITYTLTYSATDQTGNTGSATRTVVVGTGVTATTTPEVVDTTSPVITLIGNTTESIEQNTTYTDAGATATDDTDGDITANITTVNGVDTTTVGSYTVTYNVTDQAGNQATEVTRTVTVTAPVVVDTTAPVITLVGNSTETIDQDSTYTDAGATATDDTDGDVTSTIVTVNPVDTSTEGTYTISFNVTDTAGNVALEVTREVTVASTTPAI